MSTDYTSRQLPVIIVVVILFVIGMGVLFWRVWPRKPMTDPKTEILGFLGHHWPQGMTVDEISTSTKISNRRLQDALGEMEIEGLLRSHVVPIFAPFGRSRFSRRPKNERVYQLTDGRGQQMYHSLKQLPPAPPARPSPPIALRTCGARWFFLSSRPLAGWPARC